MPHPPHFNVVFAVDENYLPYLNIALKSLLAHHDQLQIFVLSHQPIAEQLARLAGYCAARSSALHFVHITESWHNAPCTDGYISRATYLRYYIASLFEYSHSAHWLYLDCDLLVNGRVDAPFLLPSFADVPLAAVSDPFVRSLPNHPFCQDDYFNAGVLYINAAKWHHGAAQLRALTDALSAKLVYGDQDVLNTAFKDNWLKLPKAYNFQMDHLLAYQQSVRQGDFENPKILHFTGSVKPLDDKKMIPIVRYEASLFRFYERLSWDELLGYPIGLLNFELKEGLDRLLQIKS